ncbi:MAG: hypothetical protein IJL70_00140, partial [Treponema sp.]|nr:hypothetical protein [Treponema sp.]
SDWTKSKTYAADVMSLGTAPSGVTLTAVDDNNGGFNAKLAGLTKDSKYKLTATPTNDSKLTIALASSNYTLFSLAGYALAGTQFGWTRTVNLDGTSAKENADHSLVYTYDFTASSTETEFVIVDNMSSGWSNKFQPANGIAMKTKPVTESGDLGSTDEVTLLYRRINGTPKAYNTSTGDYVDWQKEVTQRVTKFNPFNKEGEAYETFAKTYKSEQSVKTIWQFNVSGKTIVAADPYAIEDGSFATKWAGLTAEQKAAYQNGVAAIDTLVTASKHTPSDSDTNRYGTGWVGKLTEYPTNSYYPTTLSSKGGDLPEDDSRKLTGLIIGQPYRVTVKVTTKGVVSVKVEETYVKSNIVVSMSGLTANKEYAINGDVWKNVKATSDAYGNVRFPAAAFDTRQNYNFTKQFKVTGEGLNWDGNVKVNKTPTADKQFFSIKISGTSKPADQELITATISDLSMKIIMKVPNDIAAKDRVTIDSNLSWGGFKNGKWADINTDDKFKSGPSDSGNELVVVPNKTEKTITFFISADYDVSGSWVESQAAAGTNFKFQFTENGYKDVGGWFKISTDSVQNLVYTDKK